ncbi:MAG: hypothetical protein AAFX87_17150 [Bacteroidota bacterium]
MKPTKLLHFICVLLLLAACSDQEQITRREPPIEHQSYEQRVAYTHRHLSNLSQIVGQMARNPTLRQLLYEEAAKRFDGETNVILEVLIEKAKNSHMSLDLEAEEAIESLNAFKGIEGVNYYPQIFVPNLEYFKRNTALRSEQDLNDPTIVLFTGDESQEVFQGYSLGDDLTLIEEPDLLVDETYAGQNETWVLSLNETVTSECAIAELIGEEGPIDGEGEKSCLPGGRTGGTGGTGGGGSGSGHATPSATITDILVACHHESWAAGQSEVHMITLVHSFEFIDGELNLYGGNDHQGGRIAKIPRDDVSNLQTIDVNFDVVNCWDDRAPGLPYGSYVIFEYDGFPTGKKDITWLSGGRSFDWEYKSADEAYDNSTLFKVDFSRVQFGFPCIEWAGIYQ